ncbi:MAG: U32 family peptidase [Bacteroidales bacterium]
MTDLELLAPAKNLDIGIAAIDCGADAVYMAGPLFGARQAAGNSVEDIRKICSYAHRFGARIFVTLNTILYEDEIEKAFDLAKACEEAGADALIVQDLSLTKAGLRIPLHASTQCAIRTPEKALFYESLGFTRLVLERELSLEQVRAIRAAVSCELEFFVHGALCVCYSGQCYLSEYLAGRSANRGACIQACRSLYDLTDGNGKVLVKNKALLSMKDFNLKSRLAELAEAGICSFKIEGRLKNESYVKNVTRDYSLALDEIVSKAPDKFRRASFGKVMDGFIPDTEKTFNRSYTSLFIDGERGQWAAMDAAKSMGEFVGTVLSVRAGRAGESHIRVRTESAGTVFNNGDGFSFVTADSRIHGFRGDVCVGDEISCKRPEGLGPGARLYRNFDSMFEKRLEASRCVRTIDVDLKVCTTDWEYMNGSPMSRTDSGMLSVTASTEDGRTLSREVRLETEMARDESRMKDIVKEQLSKKSGIYRFRVSDLQTEGNIRIMSASFLNALRRDLAAALDEMPALKRAIKERGSGSAEASASDADKADTDCTAIENNSGKGTANETVKDMAASGSVVTAKAASGISVKGRATSYKDNIANSTVEKIYQHSGLKATEDAYEISHKEAAELMRTKYCVRHELGLCPKINKKEKNGPLFLINNGRKLKLEFHCRECEMTVTSEEGQSGVQTPSVLHPGH